MPVAKSHADVLKDIKSKSFQPVYLLHGEEPFFTDLLAQTFEDSALSAADKSFNQQVLYGRDITASQVIDASSRYPMMAPHQLVLVKEAQDLTDFQKLETYLKQPVPSTVLVLAYRGKKLNGNTKAYRAIVHAGVAFESKPLYSNQVPGFVAERLKAHKRTAEPGVTDLLADYLGAELGALSGAIDKLLLNVPADRSIGTADIETHVGISRQYNVFELQDSLGAKQAERTVRIGYVLAQNERDNPLPLTLASLYSYFSSLFAIKDVINASEKVQQEATEIRSSFRLGKVRGAARGWSREQLMSALLLLEEYDLKSKGVDYQLSSGSGGGLTLELVERLVALA